MPLVGELAGLVSAFTWGLTTILVRAESRHLDVLLHNAVRSTFGSLYMLALVLLVGLLGLHTPAFGPQPLLGVALLVLSVALMVGAGDSLYFLAVQRIGVARAMPISASFPLITTLIAVLFLAEPMTPGLLGGLVLIPSGLYLVTMPTRGRVVVPKADAAATRLGVGLALAAATFWAISTVVVRPALDQVDVLTGAAIRSSAGSLSVWLLVWSSGRLVHWRQLTRRRLGMAALGGSLNTIGSLFFIFAVHQAGAARTAILTATSPLYTVPLSTWLLGEQVTRRMGLGTVLTVVGLILVVGF